MVLEFIRYRAGYNPLIDDGRSYLRKTDTMTGKAAEDPQNGGSS
jgi:hypothetical protein